MGNFGDFFSKYSDSQALWTKTDIADIFGIRELYKKLSLTILMGKLGKHAPILLSHALATLDRNFHDRLMIPFWFHTLRLMGAKILIKRHLAPDYQFPLQVDEVNVRL